MRKIGEAYLCRREQEYYEGVLQREGYELKTFPGVLIEGATIFKNSVCLAEIEEGTITVETDDSDESRELDIFLSNLD